MGLRNRWADANATVERQFEDFVADGDLERQPATKTPSKAVPLPSLSDAIGRADRRWLRR